MDASIIQLSWSVVAICSIALVAFLTSVAVSLHRSYKQRLRLQETEVRLRHSQDAELAITLQQTLTDLTIRDREVHWLTVRVARVVQESADVRSYYLLDLKCDSLPRFLPGQHILVERPGVRGTPAVYRCYSLSDDCDEGYWRITVKRVANHLGSVSCWLHEEIHEGDTLRVRGPAGSFYLRSCTARNAVFLSAGVGITPLLPMLYQADRRPHGSIHFLAQFRDTDHAPLAESLLRFALQNADHRIQLWFSRFQGGANSNGGADSHGGPDLTGSRNLRVGKFNASDICHEIEALEETDCYLCGPEAWVEQLSKELIQCGVLEENIHFELFHAAGNASDTLPDSLANYVNRDLLSITRRAKSRSGQIATQKASVHFRQSNCLAEFDAHYSNLLSLASSSKIAIQSGCRTGACGSCAVKLLQGKVRYTTKPQYALKPTEILPCVCVPDGDIVVDA